MKRRQWVSAALGAALVVVAITVLPMGGADNNPTFAHIITATPGVNLPHLELDMVKDGSYPNTWCNPVDNAASHVVGDDYEVAVCLTSAPAGGPPSNFNFKLHYDNALNQCVLPKPRLRHLRPELPRQQPRRQRRRHDIQRCQPGYRLGLQNRGLQSS